MVDADVRRDFIFITLKLTCCKGQRKIGNTDKTETGSLSVAMPQLAGLLIIIVFGIILIMIMVIIASVGMAVVADGIQHRA